MFKVKLPLPNLKPLFTKAAALFYAETAGVALVLVGVAHYCWPAAVIAAGVVLVAAVERNT